MSEEQAMRLQELSGQLQSMQSYMQSLEEQTQEITLARESIDEIQLVKKDTPIFAPLHNGIFIEAKLGETKKFLINVGGNVVVAKNPHELQSILIEQQQELKKAQEAMIEQFSKMYQEYFQLQMNQ